VSTPENQPAQLRAVAEGLAQEAAAFVRQRRAEVFGADAGADGDDAVQSKTTPTDPVTVVDTETERLLRDRLARLRSGDVVLGEEIGGPSDPASIAPGAVTWVLDPIDGTVNFVLGIPWFSVSVAACIDGRPVAGCVADPNRAETFHARLGGGSFLRSGGDSTRLTGPRDVSLAEAVMGTGFAYSAPVRVRQARVLAELVGRLGNVRRLGSAALDLCYVGAGRLDAYFEAGLADWDMAAGMLIASEAGVQVGALEGSSLNDGVLAAPPRLYDELAAALTELGAHRVFDGLRG
jgi:myo-inositol-1(or 4)-monophosphatase